MSKILNRSTTTSTARVALLSTEDEDGEEQEVYNAFTVGVKNMSSLWKRFTRFGVKGTKVFITVTAHIIVTVIKIVCILSFQPKGFVSAKNINNLKEPQQNVELKKLDQDQQQNVYYGSYNHTLSSSIKGTIASSTLVLWSSCPSSSVPATTTSQQQNQHHHHWFNYLHPLSIA